MSAIVFHCGYAKAGSTWLQKQVFPNLPNVNYLGRRYTVEGRFPHNFRDGSLANVVESIATQACPNLQLEEAVESLTEVLRRDRLNVMSDENLLRPGNARVLAGSLSALARSVDSVRVLLIVREQWSLVWSRYMQDYRFSGKEQLLEEMIFEGGIRRCFFPWCLRRGACECQERNQKSISLDYYDFGEVLRELKEDLVGVEVHLVPAEALFSLHEVGCRIFESAFPSIPGCMSVLSGRGGHSVNRRGDDERARIADLNGAKLAELREQVRGRFKRSNKRLGEELGIDLEEFGYASR
ncbi:MAG: hypothetical protein AAF357_05930 [Verrucomicrobiota bacterium]